MHRHLVGDDEGRVEADAKLADQLRVAGLIARQVTEKLGGAGAGNGSQMLDGLIAGHANAVVGDGQSPLLLIEDQPNTQLTIIFVQRGLGERLETQLVGRIGRIGDELAQEDFFVGIEAVRHQAQQLFDFGLKPVGFGMHGFGHGCFPCECDNHDRKLDGDWAAIFNPGGKPGLKNVNLFQGAPAAERV